MSNHASLAKPFNGSESQGGNSASDGHGADYFQFSGSDWSSAQSRNCAQLKPQEQDLEIVDSSQKYKYEFAQDDLKNAKSTAARLTALEKISASGTDSFAFQDKDGVERQFRVETSRCGDKTLIHCYGKDADGNEQIVMRVARNADGELEPERNKDGKPVSYYGDNWSRTMQDKSVLTGEGRNESCADHHPESKPGKSPGRGETTRVRAERDHRKDDCDANKNERRSASKHDRDLERTRDRERGRERGSEQVYDRDRERDASYRNGESCRQFDEKHGPRLDIGRTLADLAMVAAPFLMAQMNNSNRCHDYYPYRHYPGNLPERGCRNYYDSYGANCGYQNFRNQQRGFCR